MPLRAFVGLPVGPEPAIVDLLQGLAACRADLKVVDPANLHFTLAFLGSVPDEAPAALAPALDDATRPIAPFALRLRSVGAFPSARRPRVVWAGVEDAAQVSKLALAVRDAAAAAGFPEDGKDFHAHLTLARVRSERNLSDAVAFLKAHGHDALPEVPVREVRLYQSVLSPQGPAYKTLHVARLEG